MRNQKVAKTAMFTIPLNIAIWDSPCSHAVMLPHSAPMPERIPPSALRILRVLRGSIFPLLL